jgi:NADPH2 dehydrogenase
LAHLFTPYTLQKLELKNRIVMSPMCQYSVSAKDGKPNDWHYIHYVSRAVGGAGLIMLEMTDVEPDGRISDYDLGLWSDDQIDAFARINDACHEHGAKTAIQIAHAGRKAEDASIPVAPSAIRFSSSYKEPRALSTDEVKQLVEKFRDTAKRAVKAGFDTVELHGAHGYLIHQFHSPLTNKREDIYGQDLARFGIEVIQAVKSELPSGIPLIMRVSAIEYEQGGYGLDHIVHLARQYKEAGVDLFDVSSGGESAKGPSNGKEPGYQVPFARHIKDHVNIPVMSVGNLSDYNVAELTVASGDSELVAVGRGMLGDPYWSLHAAKALGADIEVPRQYKRGL